MSTRYNPSIILDKLTLCYDAGNVKSYPGSGTTITDLVGGNAGTMNNSPTIESSPTKHINMSGNSGTVEFTDYKPTTFHGTSFTLEFFYTDINGSNKGIFLIVLILCVTSSPTMPSPLVRPRTKRPSL